MIESTYTIHKDTLAILPARQIDYDSLVLEKQTTVYRTVRQTPLKLIQSACIAHWFTYDGRRQAVMQHLDIRKNVPIPIHSNKGIIFFPTCSPKNDQCAWIAAPHIAYIQKAPAHIAHASLIHFKNGQTLPLNISAYTLNTQMHRAQYCMYRMQEMMEKAETPVT